MIDEIRFFNEYDGTVEALRRLGWRIDRTEPKPFEVSPMVHLGMTGVARCFRVVDDTDQVLFSCISLAEIRAVLKGVGLAQNRWLEKAPGKTARSMKDVLTPLYRKDVAAVTAYDDGLADYKANEHAKLQVALDALSKAEKADRNSGHR